MVEPGVAARGRRAGLLDQHEHVVAARAERGLAVGVAMHPEPERVLVEGERAVEVGDRQVVAPRRVVRRVWAYGCPSNYSEAVADTGRAVRPRELVDTGAGTSTVRAPARAGLGARTELGSPRAQRLGATPTSAGATTGWEP